MKKVMSLILSLLMMFSIATSALAAPSTSKEVLQQSNEQRPAPSRVNKLKADDRAEGLKDNDQVRVIVELKGKPAIEYATERGVKVTQLEGNFLQSITDGIANEQNRVKQEITAKK
ncbi:MAG: hypothetical protein K0R09_3561, partial [Clostridiales bacterium]|nr:hypothetical protein [Clostridiales bacterium]